MKERKIQRIEVRNCLSCFTNALLKTQDECVFIVYNTKKQRDKMLKILWVYRNFTVEISDAEDAWIDICNKGYLSKYFFCSRKNIFKLRLLCKYLNVKVIIINNENKKVI